MYTISILVVFLFAKHCYTSGDICSRKFDIITVAKCGKNNSKYCCANIKLHDDTISKNIFKRCYIKKDKSCLAGFYSRNDSAVPCPVGYYCPNGHRCMIPCTSGAYCPGYQLVNNNTLCVHLETSSRTIPPTLINNQLVCPGESSEKNCEKDFYCPTPWEKIPCPVGKRCLRGFSYPLRCNMFGKCSYYGSAKEELIGFVLLGVLVFVVTVVTLLKLRLRNKSLLMREEVACLTHNDSGRARSKSKAHFNIPAALWNSLKVDITGFRKSLPKIRCAFTLHCEDLTFTLKSGRKLLRGVEVTFQHSKVNVLMGPSGCGKSTLINSIMGYNKDYGDTTGNLYLNGVAIQNLSKIKNYVGYVTQHDIMHENLTVKEILTYQAQLKLPEEDKDNKYITSSVTEVINLLALNQIGDRVVGNLDDNLISGGQRRRLSIGMELITNPSLLIMDEPTSGLDSATSLIIMQLLRNLSHQMHINVICIIHQPRIELFSLFDNLTLLTTNGRVAYNSKAALIKDYFTQLGFMFPEHTNPADIIIDILSGFIVSEEYEVRHLYNCWKNEQAKRELSSSVIDLLDGVPETDEFAVETLLDRDNPQQFDKRKMKSPGYFDQWLVMMHRDCICNIRLFNQTIAEICIAFLLGLGMAFLFRNMHAGMETTKVNLEIVTIGLLVSVSSLRTFGRERLIFLREAKSGVHTFSYFFSKMFMHLPTICFFIPTAFVGIYWTGGDFKGPFSKSYLLFTLAAFAASGLSYFISVTFKPNISNLVSIGVTLIASMFAGCTLTLCDLDSLAGLGPILYTISYARWFVQAQLISEWSSYDETYKMYFQRRFWKNKYEVGGEMNGVLALLLIGVAFRVLTLMVLFYQKANVSLLHELRICLRKRRERRKTPESHITMSDFTKKFEKQTLI